MTDSLDATLRHFEATQKLGQEMNRLKGPVFVEVGFKDTLDKYAKPQPSGETAFIVQQQAILENNDQRLSGIIADMGGVEVCARLFAAQFLSGLDRINSIKQT